MNNQAKTMDRYMANIKRMSILTSHLTTEFANARTLLLTSNNDWKRKHINPMLLDFFNASLGCDFQSCPTELMVPQECLIEKESNMVRFRFLIQHVEPDIKVLKADTFRTIKRINGTGFLCVMEYIGNIYTVYDSKHNCVRTLRKEIAEDGNNKVMLPMENICFGKPETKRNDKLWREEKPCTEFQFYDDLDIIQVKIVGDKHYIS